MRNIIVNAAPYAFGATGQTGASRPQAGSGLGVAIQTIRGLSGQAPQLISPSSYQFEDSQYVAQ